MTTYSHSKLAAFESCPRAYKFAYIERPEVEGFETADAFMGSLRYLWEVKEASINNKWFYLSKGGEFNKWDGNTEYVINWENDGLKIKNFLNGNGKPISTVRNPDFYFRQGITYTLNSDRFSARYLDKSTIIEANGPGLYPNKIDLYYLLGFMNSHLVGYLLTFLSPTIAFNISEIAKVPFRNPTSKKKLKITKYAKENLFIKKLLLKFVINDREFNKPAITWGKERLEGGV